MRIALAVTFDAQRRRFVKRDFWRVAAAALGVFMGVDQPIIRQIMIEALAVEHHDIRVTPLVLGMTSAAFAI